MTQRILSWKLSEMARFRYAKYEMDGYSRQKDIFQPPILSELFQAHVCRWDLRPCSQGVFSGSESRRTWHLPNNVVLWWIRSFLMRENCFTVKKKFSAYQEVQPKKVNVKKLLNPSKEVSLLDTIISWVYLTKFPICRALIFSTKSTVNNQATEIIRPLRSVCCNWNSN